MRGEESCIAPQSRNTSCAAASASLQSGPALEPNACRQRPRPAGADASGRAQAKGEGERKPLKSIEAHLIGVDTAMELTLLRRVADAPRRRRTSSNTSGSDPSVTRVRVLWQCSLLRAAKTRVNARKQLCFNLFRAWIPLHRIAVLELSSLIHVLVLWIHTDYNFRSVRSPDSIRTLMP